MYRLEKGKDVRKRYGGAALDVAQWTEDVVVKALLGLQLLYIVFAMARVFHQITGAGTGTSILIGGFGGLILIVLIYRKFPKYVLGLAAGAWAIGGLMLGNAVFGTPGATVVLGLICGAIGFGLNAAWFADVAQGFEKGEAFGKAIFPDVIAQKDREGLTYLWHALRRLDRMKVVDEATFKRLDGDIAGILKMSDPPEGSAPMPTNDVADGFEAVRLMKDNGMIDAAEADVIRARIEARENEPRQVPRTQGFREPRGRAPMALNSDGSLTDTERQVLAAYLPKLVENRALSSASYARVMAVLEPRSATHDLSAVEFPHEDSADADDLETIERLYKAGLIDAVEYRRGLQVILPYLHSAKA